MYPRNLIFLQYPTRLDLSALPELLPLCEMKSVGMLEVASNGFVSPFGHTLSNELHHQGGNWHWLTVGAEKRILPPAVIAHELGKRVDAMASKEGRVPGARERKRMKDDLLHELIPRSFVSFAKTDAFMNSAMGLLVVDTSSRSHAESVTSNIRALLGSFPARMLNPEVAPRSVLTGWVSGESMPAGLALGEECVLRDPVEGGASVSCKNQELLCDEVDKHLEAGKQVTQLGLVFCDRLSFVLGDDLTIKKLKFLDGALDRLGQTDDDDLQAELDARFALATGEIAELYTVIVQAFQITPPETLQ